MWMQAWDNHTLSHQLEEGWEQYLLKYNRESQELLDISQDNSETQKTDTMHIMLNYVD